VVPLAAAALELLNELPRGWRKSCRLPRAPAITPACKRIGSGCASRLGSQWCRFMISATPSPRSRARRAHAVHGRQSPRPQAGPHHRRPCPSRGRSAAHGRRSDRGADRHRNDGRQCRCRECTAPEAWVSFRGQPRALSSAARPTDAVLRSSSHGRARTRGDRPCAQLQPLPASRPARRYTSLALGMPVWGHWLRVVIDAVGEAVRNEAHPVAAASALCSRRPSCGEKCRLQMAASG
jgi:hypothetical protein